MRRLSVYILGLCLLVSITANFGLINTVSAKAALPLRPNSNVCTNQNSCDGQNPETTLDVNGQPCIDTSYTVLPNGGGQISVVGGTVYLLYSTGCKTNWAETDEAGFSNVLINANITRETDNRHYDKTIRGNYVSSPMVYAPTARAKACGSVNNKTGGCTPYL